MDPEEKATLEKKVEIKKQHHPHLPLLVVLEEKEVQVQEEPKDERAN